MKKRFSIDGKWQIFEIDKYEDFEPKPESKVFETDECCLLIDVLSQNGLISKYAFESREDLINYFNDKIWCYKKEFVIEDDFIQTYTELSLKGTSGKADIFLNNHPVLTINGMYPDVIDITGKLKKGLNTIYFKFRPVIESDNSITFLTVKDLQIFNIGIKRALEIVSYDRVSIKDINIETEIESGYSLAWISVEVDNHTDENITVVATIVVSIDDAREQVELVEHISPDGGLIEAVIRIEQHDLWWPNGFGSQTLYNCMIGLKEENKVRDVAECKFGIRSVDLTGRTQKNSEGFTLLVNGEEIFCKGINMDSDQCQNWCVSKESNEKLTTLIKNANINIIRISDSKLVPEEFYSYCDEMGILVIQELTSEQFSMPENINKTVQVVRKTVKTLRKHPSVVVWSGTEYGKSREKNIKEKNQLTSSESIWSAVSALDNSRPYCTFPFCQVKREISDKQEKDSDKISWLEKNISEIKAWRTILENTEISIDSNYGVPSTPNIISLKDFIPEDSLISTENDLWEFYNTLNFTPAKKEQAGQKILNVLIESVIGKPKNLNEYLAYSGILQGEILKTAIENDRREKWTVSWSMLAHFVDWYPKISPSIIDHRMMPKPAYYYVKRAFAPIILSFKEESDKLVLYAISDEKEAMLRCNLQVGLLTFGSSDFDVDEVKVAVRANSSQAIWEIDKLSSYIEDRDTQCVAGLLYDDSGRTIARNIYYPKPIGKYNFPSPKIFLRRSIDSEFAFKLMIESDDFARNIEIVNLPETAVCSDNFFDLIPGETYEVEISGISEEEGKKVGIHLWRR
ncbi:MAG: glycoside hydrolase family 2 TIM barrel-domain containing protein [Armatimonadota bacterium]